MMTAYLSYVTNNTIMAQHLTLVIPALLPDELYQDGKFFKENHLHALQTLIKRSDQEIAKYSQFERLLCSLFHIETDQELPLAAITALNYDLTAQQGYWLRMDPVQLQADLAGVYLLGSYHLGIKPDELQQLTSELSLLLAKDMTLYTPNPVAWFLQCPSMPLIQTVPPLQLLGKEISAYLPQGADSKSWGRLMTEMQMVLHQSPVNRERELEGKPLINGIWFWGAGALPAIPSSNWQSVAADDELGIGLAKLSKIQHYHLPQSLKELTTNTPFHQGNHLVVIENLRRYYQQAELDLWLKYLRELETHWFAPILKALKNKTIDRLTLYWDQRLLTMTKKSLPWLF